MKHIMERYIHIAGQPLADTTKQTHKNYVEAILDYETGKGYFWRILRIGRWMMEDVQMRSFSICDRSPHLYECLIECKRATKKREQEAREIFITNVIPAIKNRLGYEIDDKEE